MFDLAAIGIAAACFAFIFALLWALERVRCPWATIRAGRLAGRVRVSRLRTLPRGEPLVTGQGWARSFVCRRPEALGIRSGLCMARVYTVVPLPVAGCFLSAPERGFCRLLGMKGARPGLEGLRADGLIFSARLFRRLYALIHLQGHLFLNPDGLKGVPSHISLNTAMSFVTNTNWQYYGGEYTMSYLTADGRPAPCRTGSRPPPAWPCSPQS